jgi:phosphoglycerol transferase
MRKGLASLGLLAAALIALALATDARVALWQAGPAQAALLAAGLGLAWPEAARRAHPALAAAALAALALLPFAVLLRMHGYVDLVAVRYHLEAGITPMSLQIARNPVVVALWACASLLVAVHALGRLWGRPVAVALGAALVLGLANPGLRAAAAAAAVARDPLDLAARIADPPRPATPASPEAPPDAPHVVLVYLEGFERAFADRDRFGEAYAPLERLGAEGLVFTGIRQIQGTGWSAAGMAASQCGLPLVPRGALFHNMLIAEPAILPGHLCLGDLLAARGYEAGFVLGGEAIFAGISTFYQGHGGAAVVELADLLAGMTEAEAEAAFPGWVVDDAAVFDAALDRFARGAATGRPQFLAVETFGPHGPDHLLSRPCTADGRAVVGDDPAAAAACLARLTEDFVRALPERAGGRPLLVAILSDHLNHDRRLRRHEEARRNTAILLGPGLAPGTVAREGAMIDLYPTLLDILGLGRADGRAGLGASLLGEGPTLVEEIGARRLDDQIRYDPALRDAIWRASPPP